MNQVQLTPSQENYLEWISRLSGDGPVHNSAVAEKIGVSLPSVSRAIKGLARLGLVEHKSYGSIKLTAHGKKLAEELERRHKCLTRLLVDVLGFSAEKAAAEVHRLEHVVSYDVLKRLETLVDFAISSEAWIKRLRLRMRDSSDNPDLNSRVVVGKSKVHAGDFGAK